MMSDKTYTLRKLTRPAKRRNGVAAPAASNQGGSTASYLSILEQKLDKAVFDELFEKVEVDGKTWIEAKYSLYSVGSVSAKGPGYGADSGAAGYGLLQDWAQYSEAEGNTMALSAALGMDLYRRITQGGGGLDEAQLALYLADNNYAKKSDFPTTLKNPKALSFGSKSYDGSVAATITAADLGALTDHQAIFGLTLKAGAFAAKTYTPTSATATVNIPTSTDHITEGTNKFFTDLRAQSALSSHTGDTAIHITSTERAKWNKVITDLSDLFTKVEVNGKTWIRANYAFYSVGSLSGLGPGEGAGTGSGSGGGGGYDRLDAWGDYALAKAGYVLSAALGYELHTRVTSIEGSYVDKASVQEITGGKIFRGLYYSELSMNCTPRNMVGMYVWDNVFQINKRDTANTFLKNLLRFDLTDEKAIFDISVTAPSFIKSGGTSSQFLKADGSVDSNNYALASALGSYVDKTNNQEIGGTKTFISNDAIRFSGGDVGTSKYRALITSYNTAIPTSDADYAWKIYHSREDSWRGLALWSYDGNNKIFNQVARFEAFGGNKLIVLGKIQGSSIAVANGSSSQFIKADGSLDSNSYLPLSGGTLTGQLIIKYGGDTKLVFNNTDGEQYTKLSFQEAGTEYSSMIFNKSETVFGYKPVRAPYFIANATTLCSNLNADLLDGQHGSWYQKNGLLFHRVKTAAAGVNVDPTTDLINGGMIRNCSSTDAWVNAPAGITYGQILMLASDASASLSGQLAWDVNHNSETPTRYLWWRAGNNLGFKNDWHQIAFTDSNVASATKLSDNTAFKAWGQTFFENGKPKTVSGNLNSVKRIEFLNANTTTESYRAYLHQWDNLIGFCRANTSWVWVDDLFYLDMANRNAYLYGKVGIKTTSPAYDLDVNGSVRINGDFYIKGIKFEVINGKLCINGSAYTVGSLSGKGPDQG